jgi:Flp pilus assembly protein TadD
VLLLESGKYREAVSDLDRLISINSTDFMYFYNRGFAKLQLNDIDGAIADYRTVLRLKPDDNETRKNLQILVDSRK